MPRRETRRIVQLFNGNSASHGQALFLVLLFTSLVFAAVVTLSLITRRQVSIASDIKESARAVAAADAGAEQALFRYWKEGADASGDDGTKASPIPVGSKGETYWYFYDFTAPTCPLGEGACFIEATGQFRDVHRTFRIDF